MLHGDDHAHRIDRHGALAVVADSERSVRKYELQKEVEVAEEVALSVKHSEPAKPRATSARTKA